MIFIANNADFSANNLGQVPLFSIEDVTQSTLDFLEHYAKSFSDEQKIAVHQMLTSLGYDAGDGIYSKLDTILFPFLSKNVSEAMTNAVDWSDITKRPSSASTDKFILEGNILKSNSSVDVERNINIKSSSIPDMSFGIFDSGTYRVAGGSNSLPWYLDGDRKLFAFATTVSGIPSYRKAELSDTNFCYSVNSKKILMSDNVIKTNLYEEENYESLLVAAVQGKSTQYLRPNYTKGFSCLFSGKSMTQDEINTIFRAIKNCINAFK